MGITSIQPDLAPRKATESRVALPKTVVILITSLIIPLTFYAGPIRLSAYRIILIILIFPATYRLASGRAGRIRMADISIFLICIWSAISFLFIYGPENSIEKIGIMAVETFGSYVVARSYIRSPEQFHSLVKLLFTILVIVAPFALYETLTSTNIILDTFSKIGTTYPDVYKDARWGLDRVQGPFEHPILFGVFMGSILGLSFFVLGYGGTLLKKTFLTAFVALVASMSLSSGPLTSQTGQILFMSWETVLKRIRSRWYIFAALSVAAYAVVDILSNRSPFAVFISYFAFNSHTAYNRILIWQYGTESIWNHPVFGIGFEEWERAWFMSTSADMFWIVPAMQHGVVVWVLYLGTFIGTFLSIARKSNISERVSQYRLGYLSALFGFFIAGWATHYWNATFVLLMFMLGSGLWILDQKHDVGGSAFGPQDIDTKNFRPTYTRFPPK